MLILTALLTATPPPETSPNDVLSGMLMVLGVVLIGFVIVVSIRGKVARRNAARLDPAERIEQIKADARARRDADTDRAALQEAAQDLGGRLTAKAAMLEQLIVEADERIEALRDLRVGRRMSAANGVAPARPRANQDRAALEQAVLSLADQGQTSLQIAESLDEQVGKVELILALRQ